MLYGVTGFEGAEDLLARLGKHTMGKGCLYIKKLADIDAEVLEALIAETRKLAFDAITDGEKQASDALQEMRRAGSHNRGYPSAALARFRKGSRRVRQDDSR